MSIRPAYLAVPAALVAAVGLAWLTSATAFDGGFDGAPRLAQAAPPPPSPRRPAAMPIAPYVCAPFRQGDVEEHIARRIGNRAYLKERLDLKGDQLSAWDTFQKTADEASAKEKAKCASLPTEMKTQPSFADRFTRREERMKSRLESLEAVKPSLMALYDKLTPEQKAIPRSPDDGRPSPGPRLI